MTHIKDYIKENRDRFMDELFGYLRIPSISSKSEHKPDMEKAAQYLKEQLEKAGVDKAEVCTSDGNPVVYGEKIIDPSLPTILVYGHYDVMPAEPLEEWKSKPFEPEIRDGKIYARGANDDKGQAMMHVKAFEYLVKTGQLKCNVKFMVEGEEEVGSPNLGKWATENKDKLKADIILVSDTSMIAIDIPSVTVGLRGLTYVQVEVTGPNGDLHSGLFGGAVANPINILTKMIASLLDENNKITIPGFYDKVKEYSQEERAAIAMAPFDITNYKKNLDIAEIHGENGYTTLERTGIRPSLDVNGIWGGYQGEGAKTVLPSKAFAKISLRLVPHQNHIEIGELFKKHFESIAPASVKVNVKVLHGGQGYVCPTDIPEYKAAESAYADVYGRVPVPTYSGGSIPIISALEDVLGLKSILMGFGLETDAIHGPNENYHIECFEKGIETIVKFYEHYSKK
jgi:acetylornithine deacetylase/succinyl-diaminopimelate desuccinylase-like protein